MASLERNAAVLALLGVLGQGCSAKDEAVAPREGSSSERDAAPPKEPSVEESAAAWIGDGTLQGVELEVLYDAPTDFFCSPSGCRPGLAVDLEFNPAKPGELWVVYRQPYNGEVCEQTDPGSIGCQLLNSKVAILDALDTAEPSVEIKDDGNSWHFMRVVTALAFGDDNTFATVGEARTGNFYDSPVDYMGPTWWSADPAIFAQDFERNGSHLDMLHATPFGMGIAHDPQQDSTGQTRPVYWAFNGQLGSIDRYDFKLPHEPGGEDHSDGTYDRYVTGAVKMVSNVPSHMEFADVSLLDGAAGEGPEWWLYVADSGNQRVVRLDPNSGGTPVAIETQDDQIAEPREVPDARLEEVVEPGQLQLPSGLAVAGELLFVGDAATSTIHVFDLGGEPLGQLATELPVGSLAGLAVGPDERLYFADWNEGRVFRVQPK